MTETKSRIEIEDLYELVLLGDAQISPDGKRIAYVRRRIDREKNDYLSAIWLWDGGEDRQFTAGDKDGSPCWSPDGKSLAFLSKRDADGKARLMVLRTDGGEAVPLTDKKWEVSGIAWSPDGKKIAFTRLIPTDEFGEPRDPEDDDEDSKKGGKDGAKKKPARTKITERLQFKGDGVGFVHDRRNHICVIDVETKEVTQVTHGDFHDGAPSWSPDSNFLAFASDRNARWDAEIESQIWEVGSDGGEAPRRVFDTQGTWSDPVYSPDGKRIAFVGQETTDQLKVSGFGRLYACSRDGSGLENLSPGDDIEIGSSGITDTKLDARERVYWTRKGIWFLATVGGATNVYRWNDGITAITEGDQEIRDFSVAGDTIAFTRADLTNPAEIYLKKGISAAKQLTTANKTFISGRQIVKPAAVEFEGSGGDKVAGWLMKPLGLAPGQKAPFIIYIHGGPQAAYGHSFFHEMQMLAGRGYGILLINPHGSGGNGETYMSSIHGDWGNRDYEDFMKAADMVAALNWVDERRIGVGGGSYGGYMTSWIVGHTDRFRAALIERTLVNMLSFVGTTDVPNWWKYAWRATVDEDPMKLWKMSPIAYLKNMSTPSLIIHSENDHRCPVEQGEQIFTGLRKQGVPTRFVRFPEESHGLSRGGKPSRRVERMNEIVRWFGKYLDNAEPTN